MHFFWDFWPLFVHPMKIFHPPFAKSLFKSVIRNRMNTQIRTTYTNKQNFEALGIISLMIYFDYLEILFLQSCGTSNGVPLPGRILTGGIVNSRK